MRRISNLVILGCFSYQMNPCLVHKLITIYRTEGMYAGRTYFIARIFVYPKNKV